jgi:hypothetical protein
MDQQPSTLVAIAAVRVQASLVNFCERRSRSMSEPIGQKSTICGALAQNGARRMLPAICPRPGQLLTSAAPASRTTTENVDAAVHLLRATTLG